MRVLVTGASGHVGGAIARALTEAGDEVVALGRSRPAAPVGAFIECDLGVPGSLGAATAAAPRCDAVVHAAASLDKDASAPAVTLVNCGGTQQVLALARSWDVAALVYISSVPVIGRPLRLPVTEDHPVAPPTAYHASKLFGEHLVAIAAAGGMRACSLRLTSPVGAGMPGGRILSGFVARARRGEPIVLAGQGTRRQDYLDVLDSAAAVRLALGAGASGVYNIARGRSVSNAELARVCVKTLGSSSEVTFAGEDPEEGIAWEVSIEKAARELGFRPRVDLAASIAAVAEDDARRAGQ